MIQKKLELISIIRKEVIVFIFRVRNDRCFNFIVILALEYLGFHIYVLIISLIFLEEVRALYDFI